MSDKVESGIGYIREQASLALLASHIFEASDQRASGRSKMGMDSEERPVEDLAIER